MSLFGATSNDQACFNCFDQLQLDGDRLFERDGQSGVPEDINGDGAVDVLDLLEVLSAWGTC